MSYCTQCGAQNEEGSKFCRNCGAKLTDTAQTPVTEGASEGSAVSSVETTKADESAAASKQDEFVIDYEAKPQYYSTMPSDASKVQGGRIGFAIASLVCGILAILCCCLPVFSAVLSLAAIAVGVIALCFKYDGKGMAIAGIVLGGLGLVFCLLIVMMGSTGFLSEIVENADLYDY